jgi:Tol biopolymer transport system component
MTATGPDTQLDRRLAAFFTARAETAAAGAPGIDEAVLELDRRVRRTRGLVGRRSGWLGLRPAGQPISTRSWLWTAIALLALIGLTTGTILVGSRLRWSLPPTLHGNGVIVVRETQGFVAVDPTTGAASPFPLTGDSIAWSPDGQSYAYIDGRDIWVLDTTTGAKVRVTSCCTVGAVSPQFSPGHEPFAWSADGSRLAFADGGEIWWVHPDGSDRTQVTHFGGVGAPQATSPAWSADGSRLVFVLDAVSIATIAPDGTDSRTIVAQDTATDAPRVRTTAPVWSPDGSRIAYIEEVGLTEQVVTIRPDGTDRHVVFAVSGCCLNDYGDVAWSPDGTKIATISKGLTGSPSWSLYTMDPDGSSVVELTPLVLPGQPAWRPMP